jgi:hypothetical protein
MMEIFYDTHSIKIEGESPGITKVRQKEIETSD